MRKRKISDITGAEESQLERSNRRLSEPDKMQSDRARLEHYEPGSGGEESGSEKEKGVKRRKRNRRGNRRAKPRDSGSDRDRDGDPGSRDRGPKGPHGNGSRERPMGEEVRVS
jgi:hypothetical protein